MECGEMSMAYEDEVDVESKEKTKEKVPRWCNRAEKNLRLTFCSLHFLQALIARTVSASRVRMLRYNTFLSEHDSPTWLGGNILHNLPYHPFSLTPSILD